MQDSFAFLTNRQNKTSIEKRKSKHKQTYKDFNDSSFLLETFRPNTTVLGRTHNSYGYRNLNNVQMQLSTLCAQQNNNYVKKNIQDIVKKYNEKMLIAERFSPESTVMSNQSSKKSQSQPRNIRQMKICGLSYPVRYEVEEVIGQPFFINAKQKFARMLARKKEKQLQFQTLQFKVKEIEAQKLFTRRLKDKSFQNPQHVTNAQWDNQWRRQSKKQIARYRTRLSVKHKKNSSNMTIQW